MLPVVLFLFYPEQALGREKLGNTQTIGKQSWIICAMWDQKAYVQNYGFRVGFEGELSKLLFLSFLFILVLFFNFLLNCSSGNTKAEREGS